MMGLVRHGSAAHPSTRLAVAPDRSPAPQEPRPSFAEWLEDVRAEALSRGIRPDIVENALKGIDEPMPVVIERDRSQAEIVVPLDKYIRDRLKPSVIRA